MREQLSAGLDPVAVHPTHSGVGPRKGHLARFFTIFDSESTFEDPFYSFALFRLLEKKGISIMVWKKISRKQVGIYILKRCWRFCLGFSVWAVPKNTKEAKKARNAKKAAGNVLQ